MGKALFIRGGAIGDFILTLPSIRLFRESLPGNDVEILGYPSIANLAVAAGLADRVRSIESARLASFFAAGGQLDEEWAEYFTSFDIIFSYLYDPDGIFATNLEKAGVKTLLSCPFRPRDDTPFLSAARQLAQPLETLALFLDDPVLNLSYQAPDPLPDWQDGPTILIHPGSGSPSKNWGFESWARLMEKISLHCPEISWVVVNGEAETEIIPQFIRLIDQLDLRWTRLENQPLPEIGALCGRASLFLGHDSGISHLAASAGCPSMLLFGPTNPLIWAPEAPHVHYLRSESRSLASLSVDHVWQNLKQRSFFTFS